MQERGYIAMKKRVIVFVSLSIWIFGVSLSGIAAAAEKGFPNKELTVIVSLAAGGPRDIVARGVSQVMSKYLGVPMVVSNMPGAGGARGMNALYQAVPDGYTIGLGTTSDVIAQILEKQDYDMRNYSILGTATTSTFMIYVKSDSPFKSSAPGTVGPIMLLAREKIPIRVIGGFKNVNEATYSMLRGEGELVGTQAVSAVPLVKAGEMRPILAFVRQRLPDYPEVQTVAEMGYEDIADVATMDTCLMGPPKVPKERVKILEDALMKTLKDPEFLKWAKTVAAENKPLNSEDTIKGMLGLFKSLEPYKEEIVKYTKQ
jgi:tripartite-type tricarboxylate transporter receptor subunit TctC